VSSKIEALGARRGVLKALRHYRGFPGDSQGEEGASRVGRVHTSIIRRSGWAGNEHKPFTDIPGLGLSRKGGACEGELRRLTPIGRAISGRLEGHEKELVDSPLSRHFDPREARAEELTEAAYIAAHWDDPIFSQDDPAHRIQRRSPVLILTHSYLFPKRPSVEAARNE
jgi:hypothetical protein